MREISTCGQHSPSFAFGTQPCWRVISLATRLPAMRASPITQFRMQARAAVSALMSAKFLSNFFCELGIFSLALTDRTLAPGVKATFRDTEHAAHDDNGKFLLMLVNKLIVHLDSREKMPTAFMK